jgi:adenylylsulfate kinase-like enzyme
MGIHDLKVYWLTGISNVGKTTLGQELSKQLRTNGYPSLLIDGDLIRTAIGDPSIGYDYQSRLINARRIARIASMCAEQQLHVVVATISLFHEIHSWNRKNLPGYFEVWLRRENNIHKASPKAQVGPRVGCEIPPEYPRAPNLILNNDHDLANLRAMAGQILQKWG